METYVEVSLDQSDRTYSYECSSPVTVGDEVLVPVFGRSKIGQVMKVGSSPAYAGAVKSVLEVL